jgi:hypothetical protein
MIIIVVVLKPDKLSGPALRSTGSTKGITRVPGTALSLTLVKILPGGSPFNF